MPSSESDGPFGPADTPGVEASGVAAPGVEAPGVEASGVEAPDVRDGLTRAERIILTCMREAEAEIPGRNVPTAMLYGRVVEHLDIGQDDFMSILARLTGRGSVR